MASTSKVRCNFLICAAISSCLIQSGISILFVLVCIQVQECKINIFQRQITNSYDTFTWWETAHFLTYLTYFRNNCSWLSLDKGWSKTSCTSYRTYNWMLVYLFVNFVWMFTAVLLFVAILGKKQLNQCDRFYFCYPWIFVSVVIICTDVIATAHYALDLIHTIEPQHYFHFIGFRGNYSTAIQGHNYAMPENLFMPSVTMVLIFSKGIILWLINTAIVMFVMTQLLASSSEMKNSVKVERTSVTENATAPLIFIFFALQTSSAEDFTECRSWWLTMHTPTADQNVTSDEITSQISKIAAQHDLPTTIFSSAGNEQSYVPWMNVLYVPKTYDDYANTDKKIDGEHHYEHHYEKVICPSDLRRSINMGISHRITNANDSTGHHVPGCCRASDSRSELKEMKINVGNVSICIKHKEASTIQAKTANYPQLRIIRIPRIPSDGYDSSHISGDSIETSC